MAKIPLLKRTHLITIVLIAIAFMVLRFSGGKLSLSTGAPDTSVNDSSFETKIEKRTEDEKADEKEIKDEEASRLIKEQLVKDVLSNIEVERKRDKKEERVTGESLADIERKVGLK